jgi:hypothetical protein
MHNAYHVPQALGDQKAGDVMLITNESNSTNCANAGLFIIASLAGTRDVEDNLSPVLGQTTTTLMPRLATYSTNGKPGQFHGTVTNANGSTTTVGDCSAHWFTVKGNIVALGNYEQGTRFVDISDPRNPQQVGYFRVPATGTGRGLEGEVVSSDTASAIWHGKYVYVADYARGIDVLRFTAPNGTTQPKTCWNSCADNQTMGDWTDTPGGAGGSVPATLSLTLGTAASFGAFTPGLAKDYTASTTANIISTAGDATLSSSDPGHLMNGTFSLPSPLEVSFSKSTWNAPTSNESVTIGFKQHISAGDALRTGSYSKTLTFTLSTTNP